MYNSNTPNITTFSTLDEVMFNNSQYQTEETNTFMSATTFLNTYPAKLNMDQYNNITDEELYFQINGED